MTGFYTIQEAIDYSGLSETTIRRLLRRGTLTPYKIPGVRRTFLKREDVENLAKPTRHLRAVPDHGNVKDRIKAIGGGA